MTSVLLRRWAPALPRLLNVAFFLDLYAQSLSKKTNSCRASLQ